MRGDILDERPESDSRHPNSCLYLALIVKREYGELFLALL